MKTAIVAGVGVLLFAWIATANSGGYRFGVSDQAFYVPALELAQHETLFPRDREVLAPQLRLWLGGTALASALAASGLSLPVAFAGLYVLTLLLLFGAITAFARGLGGNWWTVAACLTLVTLRHRITKTGANSLEGYMHPRMLAFACGVAMLAVLLRGRFRTAGLFAGAAIAIHTTTGFWFAAVLVCAWLWRRVGARRYATLLSAALVVLGLGAAIAVGAGLLPRMDEAWLAVLHERDYLFPAAWPWSAWLVNLLYPVVIVWIHRRRLAAGLAAPGESGVVAGLVGLAAGFLVSVPFTAWHVALAVQLQVNRVFWLLDLVAVCFLAWWVMEDAGRRWAPAVRAGALGVLVAAAAARGYYVIGVEAERQLVRLDLPATAWVDAMRWLRAQPTDWHVLAHPSHSLMYGPSVRIAAARDTLLDDGKDPAMAMYDRGVALRVAERRDALAEWPTLTPVALRALAARYDLDVLVDTADRPIALPELYRNAQFVIYRLR